MIKKKYIFKNFLQGIILKKAPGNTIFDFGQMVSLPFENGWDQEKISKLNQKKDKIPKLIQVFEFLQKLINENTFTGL